MTRVAATSRKLRFGGANIKGTPAMPAFRVRKDMKTVKRKTDIAVLQEFRWPWYWRVARSSLGVRWGSYPSWNKGLGSPTYGAQPVIWRRRKLKRLDSIFAVAHDGRAKISENRYIRGALLTDRKVDAPCWYVGTHFVVGADEKGDGPLRKQMLYKEDIPNLDRVLKQCLATGYAVILELDANIHKGSEAYPVFVEMLEKHGGQIVGFHGVEFLVVFNNTKTHVKVVNQWTIPTSELETDHEVRGLDHRVIKNG